MHSANTSAIISPAIHCKRRIYGVEADKLTNIERQLSEGDSAWLCCALCKNKITQSIYSIIIQGSHEHNFTNPAAIPFHIGCFSHVENTNLQGKVVPQDTWFAGYSWQILKCTICSLQLGWRFTGKEVFYALILNRLINQIE